MARWKKRFSGDFSDILSQLIDLEAFDRESRLQLLDYIGSAPSLREETMLDLIVEMAETGNYESIVWDTAPAGETMNLLSMPLFIKRHLRAGVRVFEGLDKISKQLQGKRSISGIMDEWIAVSKRISRFILEKAAFVIVANAEALVVKHVERLMKTLNDYNIALHGMVINRVVEKRDSEPLTAIMSSQQRYVAELKTMSGKLPLAAVPVSQQEIRGVKALRLVGERLSRELRLS